MVVLALVLLPLTLVLFCPCFFAYWTCTDPYADSPRWKKVILGILAFLTGLIANAIFIPVALAVVAGYSIIGVSLLIYFLLTCFHCFQVCRDCRNLTRRPAPEQEQPQLTQAEQRNRDRALKEIERRKKLQETAEQKAASKPKAVAKPRPRAAST